MSDFCHAIYAGDVRCSKYKLLHGNYHMSVSGFVWTDKHPESPIEPDLAALEAQFREKAVESMKEHSRKGHNDTCSFMLYAALTCDCGYSICVAALDLHAEIVEKRKGRE